MRYGSGIVGEEAEQRVMVRVVQSFCGNTALGWFR